LREKKAAEEKENYEEIVRKKKYCQAKRISYVGELVIAQQQHWFVGLQLQDLRLEKTDRGTIDLDQTRTLLDEGNGSGGFLMDERKLLERFREILPSLLSPCDQKSERFHSFLKNNSQEP
jgi:hypothetical protein